MNVALYNPSRGHELIGSKFYPDCTPQEVREMAMLLQIEAMESGRDLGSYLMVAWQNSPGKYLGVLTLGDMVDLDEDLLNGIESLTRTRH